MMDDINLIYRVIREVDEKEIERFNDEALAKSCAEMESLKDIKNSYAVQSKLENQADDDFQTNFGYMHGQIAVTYEAVKKR